MRFFVTICVRRNQRGGVDKRVPALMRKDSGMTKTELTLTLKQVNDAVRFHAAAPGKRPVVIDYFSPPEDADGHSSLELLLMSAASCLATAVKLMAERRLKKGMSAIEVTATGKRREAPPTELTTLSFDLRCESRSLDQEELNTLVRTAEETVCPVFAMLRDDIDIHLAATVVQPISDANVATRGVK